MRSHLVFLRASFFVFCIRAMFHRGVSCFISDTKLVDIIRRYLVFTPYKAIFSYSLPPYSLWLPPFDYASLARVPIELSVVQPFENIFFFFFYCQNRCLSSLHVWIPATERRKKRNTPRKRVEILFSEIAVMWSFSWVPGWRSWFRVPSICTVELFATRLFTNQTFFSVNGDQVRTKSYSYLAETCAENDTFHCLLVFKKPAYLLLFLSFQKWHCDTRKNIETSLVWQHKSFSAALLFLTRSNFPSRHELNQEVNFSWSTLSMNIYTSYNIYQEQLQWVDAQ